MRHLLGGGGHLTDGALLAGAGSLGGDGQRLVLIMSSQLNPSGGENVLVNGSPGS